MMRVTQKPVSYTHLKVDRNKKVPITVLIRALGFGTNAEILDIFGEERCV